MSTAHSAAEAVDGLVQTWLVIAGGEASHMEMARGLAGRGARVCCADSGLDVAYAHGIAPHHAVGDFDSVSPESWARARHEGVRMEHHPVAKDASDTELALEFTAARGAREIFLFGAAGARLDQTLATAVLLSRYERRGVAVFALAPGWRYRALVPREGAAAWTVACTPGSTISLIPLDRRCTGVTIAGVAFPLSEATLRRASTYATSNRAAAETVSIRVRTGELLAMVAG